MEEEEVSGTHTTLTKFCCCIEILHFREKMLYKALPQGAAERTLGFQTWAHPGAENVQPCLSTWMCTLASDRAEHFGMLCT